jgi:hypothetical protein
MSLASVVRKSSGPTFRHVFALALRDTPVRVTLRRGLDTSTLLRAPTHLAEITNAGARHWYTPLENTPRRRGKAGGVWYLIQGRTETYLRLRVMSPQNAKAPQPPK